jgi:hypothetical protein
MKTLSKTFLATALRLFGLVMVPSRKEDEPQPSSNDLLNGTGESAETPGVLK